MRERAERRDVSLTKACKPRRIAGVALSAVAVAMLSGCQGTGGPGQWRYFGNPAPTTESAEHLAQMWVGTWITALAVGVLMWGLMGWSFTRYRRRHANEVPKQTTYNLPLEIMYTIVPFLIIGVLFAYTVKAQTVALEERDDVDVTVDVVAQKWSWTFNYADEDVWDAGTVETIPTLYLPVDERVQFNLHATDVIHSFWVPSFYMKRDAIPGRESSFQVTPNVEGRFAGKCAELCGTYHSAMLFNVEIVSRDEFDAKMEELRERGQTGQLMGSEGAGTLAQRKGGN